MPRLSVVIPVYNGAGTLPATLASLEGQARLDEIEVVAVDQASRDGSRAVLVSHAGRLPLRIVDAPEGRNWMQTSNRGLREAKAPLVSFLHQDDVWRPGRATAMLDLAARHPDAALWLHSADFIDGTGRRLGRFSPPFGGRERRVSRRDALACLLVQNTVALPGAMFRREAALARGGLSEALWYTADWDLWLGLVSEGDETAGIAWLPARLAGFRLHGDSQTVKGSRDLTDFAEQHRLPLEIHGAALGGAAGRQARARAKAAAEINLFLASRFHATPISVWRILATLLRLGPWHWPALVERSQIIQRVWPRLRALRAGSGPPAGNEAPNP
ncbi:MAG: glycosyltransferase family 2 protein [Pikeienuella sp.]